MRNYELVIVLDGKAATVAKKKSYTEKLEKLVKSLKGEVGKVKDLGTKDLAYKIKKSVTGSYLVFPLKLDSKAAVDLANKMRVEDEVIRYLLTWQEA